MIPLKRFNALDEFSFHHTLDAADGVCIILFTKPGCSACRHWKTLLQQLITHRLDVRVFEVDSEVSPALAREFELFHLPALYVYRNGHFYGELQCEGKLPVLEATLDELLRREPSDPP